jgi:3-dehydroquinate synthase
VEVELNINLGERSYPIYIMTDYSQIGASIRNLKLNGKLIVITDTNVEKFQWEGFINGLKNDG